MATLRNLLTILVIGLFIGAIAAFVMVTQAAAGPQQTPTSPGIVFSANAEPSSFSCKNTTGSGPPQFGFWIWCTAPTSTSSGDCRGSMFFYNIQPHAVYVAGAVTLTGTTATMTVSSASTAAVGVGCTLTTNHVLSVRGNNCAGACDA